MNLQIIPQRWADTAEELPSGWLAEHAPGLCRVWPAAEETVNRIAREVGISAKLPVSRMELEQGAVSYAWDGSSREYDDGDVDEFVVATCEWPGELVRSMGFGVKAHDALKAAYLCGCDKTDSGPRRDGWFGPERQLLACALRFKAWYRGRDGIWAPGMTHYYVPEWYNRWELLEDPAYGAGISRTRDDWPGPITPTNQASADCLRYTTSYSAQFRLRDIGRRWWPEDYEREETQVSKSLTILIDPGHGSKYYDGGWKTDTGTAGGGVRECEVVIKVAHEARKLLQAQGHTVKLSHETVDYSNDLGPSARGRWAAAQNYDVFWSVHLDGNKSSTPNGTSVFYPNAQSPSSKRLAESAAKYLMEYLGTTVWYSHCKPTGAGVHTTKLGVFYGGNNYQSPGALILTEAAFMTNPSDLAMILSDGFPRLYAAAVCRGIYEWAGIETVPESFMPDGQSDEPSDDPAPPTPDNSELRAKLTELAAQTKALAGDVAGIADQLRKLAT